MTGSLRALLGGVVDYAGLFPPAELSLDVAARTYAAHRASADAWMLSRFVCPVTRLDELSPLLEELVPEGDRFGLAVLLRGGDTAGAFRATLAEDLASIVRFSRRSGVRAVVDVGEVPFPPLLLDEADGAAVAALLDGVPRAAEAAGAPRLACFYEVGRRRARWTETLPILVEAMSRHNRSPEASGALGGVAGGVESRAGVKLRMGGVTADAFPPAEEAAFVMTACRDHDVPMKFTAGLHHPLRHFNEGQNVTMHGFLNVFTAGVLAWAEKLSAPRVQQILEDTSISGFMYDDERLSWKGYSMATARVGVLRERAVASFGSCSFDEPIDDLRALGLMT